MKDHTQKEKQRNITPLAAGLAGLALGAAGATAIALSDKSTRKKASDKAKQVTGDLKNWSAAKANELQKKKLHAHDQLDKEMDNKKNEIIDTVEKELENTKNK